MKNYNKKICISPGVVFFLACILWLSNTTHAAAAERYRVSVVSGFVGLVDPNTSVSINGSEIEVLVKDSYECLRKKPFPLKFDVEVSGGASAKKSSFWTRLKVKSIELGGIGKGQITIDGEEFCGKDLTLAWEQVSSSVERVKKSGVTHNKVPIPPSGTAWCSTMTFTNIRNSNQGWVKYDIKRPGQDTEESLSISYLRPHQVIYSDGSRTSIGALTSVERDGSMLTDAIVTMTRPGSMDRCRLEFSNLQSGALDGFRVGQLESNTPSIPTVRKQSQPQIAKEAEKPKSKEIIEKAENEKPDVVLLAFQAFSLEERKILQEGLAKGGFYRNAVDGLYGPGTKRAIESFLESKSSVDGTVGAVLAELKILRKSQLAVRKELAVQKRLAEKAAQQNAVVEKVVTSEIDDEYLIEDIGAFVREKPGRLDSFDLAVLFIPAKKEFEKGTLGSNFDGLKTFVAKNVEFLSFAEQQSAKRYAKAKQAVDNKYQYIVTEVDKLRNDISADPLSERAMRLTSILAKYRVVTRESPDGQIVEAAESLKAELATINSVESQETQSQVSKVARKSPYPSDKSVERVDVASSNSAQPDLLEVDSCDTNPARCSVGQLCERATSFSTGKLDWDSNPAAKLYIDFARNIGMKCGVVSAAKQIAKAKNDESTKLKKRIDKYPNRKALVIGNADYRDQAPLKNPINDAKAVYRKLEEVGFDVTYRENLTVRDFGRTLADFETSLKGSDISLFYYAGHGIEVEKRNYLIPVDANLRSPVDVRYETVMLDDAVNASLNTGKLSLVLVDACRDNPFSKQMSSVTRSVGRGLSVVEVDSGPVYQIVSFAASSGQVAEDGDGANSPYASVLIDLLDEPNLEVGKMFRILGQRVSDVTGGKQQPTKRDNLRGEDIYLVRQ